MEDRISYKLQLTLDYLYKNNNDLNLQTSCNITNDELIKRIYMIPKMKTPNEYVVFVLFLGIIAKPFIKAYKAYEDGYDLYDFNILFNRENVLSTFLSHLTPQDSYHNTVVLKNQVLVLNSLLGKSKRSLVSENSNKRVRN